MRPAVLLVLLALLAGCVDAPLDGSGVAWLDAPTVAIIGEPFELQVEATGAGILPVHADGQEVGAVVVDAGSDTSKTYAVMIQIDEPGLHDIIVGGQRRSIQVSVPLPRWDDHRDIPPTPRPGTADPEADFDAEHSIIYEHTIHGTRVVVPIHQSLMGRSEIGGHATLPPGVFAQFLFELFHEYWHIHQGYLYDEAVVPVRGVDDDCRFFTANATGFPVCYADHAQSADDHSAPPHPLTAGIQRELIAHEFFHMWNGGIIKYAPREEWDHFVPEQWFTEGVTTYYSGRVLAKIDSLDGYNEVMEDTVDDYERLRPMAGGLSFEDIAAKTLPPRSGPDDFADMLYARGTLVAYLLDVELAKHGRNLDDLMRRLYATHGLEGRPFTDADLRVAAENVTGADLSAFFGLFVTGGTDMPEGPIGFVDHVHNKVRPAPLRLG